MSTLANIGPNRFYIQKMALFYGARMQKVSVFLAFFVLFLVLYSDLFYLPEKNNKKFKISA